MVFVFIRSQWMRIAYPFLMTLLCCSAVAVTSLSAQQNQSEALFRDLRTRYFRLRNTDPELLRPRSWIALAAEFEKFVEKHPASGLSAKAIMSSASLFEQLSSKFRRSVDRDKYIELLERVVSEYPSSKESDEALIKLGDLFREQPNGQQRAYRAYSDVLERKKSIEMTIIARERLALLEKKRPELSNENAQMVSRRQRKPLAGQKIIVLDPGHGGEDLGAEGIGGLLEKDVVLDIVLRLEELLQARSDLFVHLTRRSDVFLPLAKRTEVANTFNADLFISVHTNASPGGRLEGLESYYLDNTNNEASRRLAERENRFWEDSSGSAQIDLQFMLSDLIQDIKREDSIALAGFLHKSILQNARRKSSGIKDLGIKKAPFYVLVGAHMPCVLLELLFIDNDGEGVLLGTPEFRQNLAVGIYSGIDRFLIERER